MTTTEENLTYEIATQRLETARDRYRTASQKTREELTNIILEQISSKTGRLQSATVEVGLDLETVINRLPGNPKISTLKSSHILNLSVQTNLLYDFNGVTIGSNSLRMLYGVNRSSRC